MPASAHAIPKLHHRGHEGADPEHVAALKALSWPALVAYCDEVRAGTVDVLLRAFLAAWREP